MQVRRFHNARFKKFSSREAAEHFATVTPFAQLKCQDSEGNHIQPVLPTQRSYSPAGDLDSVSLYHTVGCESNTHDIVYCAGTYRQYEGKDTIAGVGIWWGTYDPRYVLCLCLLHLDKRSN